MNPKARRRRDHYEIRRMTYADRLRYAALVAKDLQDVDIDMAFKKAPRYMALFHDRRGYGNTKGQAAKDLKRGIAYDNQRTAAPED